MELRQLFYLVVMADEQHFGQTAAKVHIAQAALSNQVLALEKELGVQLFIRTISRVELTRAGAAFYERAVRMLGEMDLSAEIVRSVAGKATKRISIGTVYSATIGVLPAFLSRIACQFLDIRMRIESGKINDIIRNIEAGRISLGSRRFFSIAHER